MALAVTRRGMWLMMMMMLAYRRTVFVFLPQSRHLHLRPRSSRRRPTAPRAWSTVRHRQIRILGIVDEMLVLMFRSRFRRLVWRRRGRRRVQPAYLLRPVFVGVLQTNRRRRRRGGRESAMARLLRRLGYTGDSGGDHGGRMDCGTGCGARRDRCSSSGRKRFYSDIKRGSLGSVHAIDAIDRNVLTF